MVTIVSLDFGPRPTPHTNNMRAMVEDLKARGLYVPTHGEYILGRILESFREAYPHILKGFHDGGLVSNPDIKPDLGLSGGCLCHPAKRDADHPAIPARGNDYGGARTGRVSVVITRNGGAK